MKSLLTRLALLAVAAAAGIALVWATLGQPAPRPDTAALNDAVHVAAAGWPSPDPEALRRVGRPLTVVDAAGTVVATTDPEPLATALDAARVRALVAPVVVDGAPVGSVHLRDPITDADAAAKRQAGWAASGAIAAMTLLAAGVLARTHHQVIRPFGKLEDFATRVASGDLDAPLAMDRGNVFGAWTESLDLMRAELAASHEREQRARDSKKALVSQISHDIRTPVASIAATAEVLRARSADEHVAERLDVIGAKATQIEQLVADLVQANATDLTTLTVTPRDVPSTELPDLVRAADYERRATIGPLPDCLVSIDPHRLAQVLDNVVANSYKYAGTPITVTAAIDGPMLVLTLTDAGPGVPDHELGAILARGVRGSNVGDTPGQGLGLFTSAHLMERMGGDLAVRNAHDPTGLAITLALPLAGDADAP